MSVKCPRCYMRNQPGAHFCGRCGQPLVEGAVRRGESGEGASGQETARHMGPVRHPDPLTPPEGFKACEEVPDLYYRWEAAWGGSMLAGTETIAVILFNGGYPLEEVVLKIRGYGVGGKEVFAVEETVDELPRRKEVTIEVPSYELPAPASDLTVSVVSGRFGSTT